MNEHDVLVAARNRIDKPQKWCRGKVASGGRRCAAGAIEAACPGTVLQDEDEHYVNESSPGAQAIDVLYRVMGLAADDWALADFNDSHTHAEVVAKFDEAIAATAPAPDTSFLDHVRVAPEVTAA